MPASMRRVIKDECARFSSGCGRVMSTSATNQNQCLAAFSITAPGPSRPPQEWTTGVRGGTGPINKEQQS